MGMKTRSKLTFWEAVELLIEAKVIDSRQSLGTNGTQTSIEIGAGGIDAHKDGFFRRADVCKLIGYARIVP
jgi:hypothetical protein